MIRVFVGLFCLLISGSIFSQDTTSLFKSGNKQVIKEPGYLYYSTTDKSGNVNTTKIDLMEVLDIFVEFKDDPLFVQMNKNPLMKVNEQVYRQTEDRFLNDITAMTKRLSYSWIQKAAAPSIKKSFHKLINGVSIEIPRIMLSSISSLDYVKKVYKNSTYEIIDDFTVSANPSVNYSVTDSAGKGIIIGIIDTGIDYMHPALGGGIGPGYKVIGGYDILDEDDDPMDTYGHGTHVAGIAAGNGEYLKGVAPGASLMAFKVQSESRITTMATIIEAVERSVDPNNDGSFDDKVDVVNMSLGASGGNPEDAVSAAVNNAVALGTVFCISVGNSGDYNTICTPGNAEFAIGVGAKDTTDNTVDFSSKGPTNKTYAIKPDIIAPGTNIYSSLPGNEYGEASGTSMSAPFVAGMCAVIKSIHNNWTPDQVKSLIMNNATFLDEPVMAQGAGIVNLQKALNAGTMVFPPSLSYGYCNTDVENWIVTDTLIIKNLSPVTKNYKLSLSSHTNYFNISPVLFSAAPGDSVPVLITLNVNNSSNPYVDNFKYYNGIINISCEDESLHIPWAFVKYPRLRINSDKPVSNVLLMDTSDVYFSASPEGEDIYSCDFLVKNGTYKLFAFYHELNNDTTKLYKTALVVKENIDFNSSAEINISSNEAINNIIYNGTDETGNKLSGYEHWLGYLYLFLPEGFPLSGISFHPGNDETISISNLSPLFILAGAEVMQDFLGKRNLFLSNYKTKEGLSSDLVFRNSFEDYKKYRLKFRLSPFRDDHNLSTFNYFSVKKEKYSYWSGGVGISTDLINPRFDGNLYIIPPADSTVLHYTLIAGDVVFNSTEQPWFLTNLLEFKNDSLGIKYSDGVSYFTPPGGVFSFGNGITHPNLISAVFDNNTYYLFCTSYGQCGEGRNSDERANIYVIYDKDSNIVKSGTIYEQRMSSGIHDLADGEYILQIKNKNYVIENTIGEFTVTTNFTKKEGSAGESNPIMNLAFYNSEDEPVAVVRKNEKASLVLKLSDYLYRGVNVSVFLRETGAENWNKIAVTQASSIFTADVTAFTGFDSTSLDLKLVLSHDLSSFEYVWKPALGIGSFDGTSDTPENIAVPASYKLYNNYPNPFNNITIIRYDLPTEAKVKLEVFNILGERITILYDGAQEAGTHEAQLNADNFASGVYIYRITAEGKSFYQKSSKMVLLK